MTEKCHHKKMSPKKKISIARSKGFIKAAHDFFGKLKDHEFYGPKVQHVFLYGEITDEKLDQLSNDILAANKAGEGETPSVNPRPIVIHINSPGGNMHAGLAMRAIMSRSRVPVCSLVEGMSASAATFVSIFAPYRVICEDAVVMIHQYSAWMHGDRASIQNNLAEIDHVYRDIVDDYLQHTKIGEKEMRDLLKHDMLMDAKWAFSKGVSDRIIAPGSKKSSASHDQDLVSILQSTSVNNIVLQKDAINYGLANSIYINSIASTNDDLKHVVIRPTHSSVFDTFDAVALSNHVRSIPATTFMLVDSSFVDLVTILPLLFCSRRVMYTHSTLNVEGSIFMMGGHLFDDIVHNTKLNFAIFKKMLKERTKMSDDMIEGLKSSRTFFTAEECLQHGIVDEIIDA